MTADVLKDSYLMATGYAALMGADAERQHLFARRYDNSVTPAELEQHWKQFSAETPDDGINWAELLKSGAGRLQVTPDADDNDNRLRCIDCGTELDTETRYQFVTPERVTYVCRDHFLARDKDRRARTTAAPPNQRQTLVRLFDNHERVANLLVDDWDDRNGEAQFTIPSEHDRAHWLMGMAITSRVSAIVMDTPETEWLIDSVTAPVRRDLNWPHPDWLRNYHQVRLVSRTRRIRESQPSDEQCREIFGVE